MLLQHTPGGSYSGNVNMNEIQLTINGTEISAQEGSTLLKAAESAGISIPTICYHDHCTANGLCRTCVVEVDGARVLVAACLEKVRPGMVVYTHSARVNRSRRTILEMLATAVDLSESPEIQSMLLEYGVSTDNSRNDPLREHPTLDDNPMYIRDYAKCLLCWRCVQVCAEDVQYTYALNLSGRGFDTRIGTFYDRAIPETSCVFCGQCIAVCPTGALKTRREWLLEGNLKALHRHQPGG